jgi:hypothetical protein
VYAGGFNTFRSGAGRFFLGNRVYGVANQGVTGSLDDMRIYNRALSASEVKQLYNMGR